MTMIILWFIPIIYSFICIIKKKLYPIFYACVILDILITTFVFQEYQYIVSLLIYCLGFGISYYCQNKEDILYFAYDFNQMFLRFGLMSVLTIVGSISRLYLGGYYYLVLPLAIIGLLYYFNKDDNKYNESAIFDKYYLPSIYKSETEMVDVLDKYMSKLSVDEKIAFIKTYESENDMDFDFIIERDKFMIGSLIILLSAILLIIVIGG